MASTGTPEGWYCGFISLSHLGTTKDTRCNAKRAIDEHFCRRE